MLIYLEGGLDGALSNILNRVSIKNVKTLAKSNKQLSFYIKKYLQERSAKCIGNFWRRYGSTMPLKKLANVYRMIKLNETDARNMGMELFVRHLGKNAVLKVSLLFYQRILYGMSDILKISFKDQIMPIRVFVSVYMIVYYSREMFNQMGESEQRLVNAATRLLEVLHPIARLLAAGFSFKDATSDLVGILSVSHTEYNTAFSSWRKPDLIANVKRIAGAVNLISSYFNLISTYHPNEEPVRTQLRHNIRRLRTQLNRIQGPHACRILDKYMVGCLVYETWCVLLN